MDKFGLPYTGMKILTLVTIMNRFFKKKEESTYPFYASYFLYLNKLIKIYWIRIKSER